MAIDSYDQQVEYEMLDALEKRRKSPERRKRFSFLEWNDLEKQAGKLFICERDLEEFLFHQREHAMREMEFIERSGKDRRR